jgi:hypothetical protein
MQEDIENRAVALAIRGTKLTAHSLKAAIAKYLAHRKNKKMHHIPTGKQTVKQLIGQGQGVSNIEITDGNIKSFERVARKYGVNYALKKDISGEHPRYLVFFKAKDTDALTAAFKEYAAKEIRREKRPSIQEQMQKHKAKMKPLEHSVKPKQLER